MGGDEDIYQAVLEVFLADVPRQLATIAYLETVNEEVELNREEIRRSAHSLKSAAANIGGDSMSQSAASFERVAGEATPEELRNHFRQLTSEFDQLKLALLPDQ